MWFYFLLVGSLMIRTHSKSVLPENMTTTTVRITAAFPTQTTPMETSTIWDTTTIPSTSITTTLEAEEETTRATVEKNKSYEFQSNFTRNNDSVLVALHSKGSNVSISINNTFIGVKNDSYPCEILFNEHSMNSEQIVTTKIVINFNSSFTRELASLLGDRLLDIADLLSTVRSMAGLNNTVETV